MPPRIIIFFLSSTFLGNWWFDGKVSSHGVRSQARSQEVWLCNSLAAHPETGYLLSISWPVNRDNNTACLLGGSVR